MSAFMVSKKHIDALVTFATKPDRFDGVIKVMDDDGLDLELTPDTATFLGRVLRDQNWRSVQENHPGDPHPREPYSHEPVNGIGPVEIIKLCHCYRYQSCETSDYDYTLAERIIEGIIERAVRQVPGYEEADWAI